MLQRTMEPGTIMILDNPRTRIALWRDVLVSVWRVDVTAEDVQATERGQERLIASHGAYVSLAIAERAAVNMSKRARDEAARITRQGAETCRAIGIVLAVDGFIGAALRAAVTGVGLLARTRVPQRSFREVPEAAAWVLGHLDAKRAESIEAMLLVEIVRKLRA